MKLYNELSAWWPVLSAPEDYEEESSLYVRIIEKYKKDIKTAIELGSGGGNNASHLKKLYTMTLVDMSLGMIEVSKTLNPECRHFEGDMRSVRLGEKFDLVFIHDAIMYMTTEEDLFRTFITAKEHMKDEGVLFIAPDYFKETFKPFTSHGGHDRKERSMRYLEWTCDKNPHDTLIETYFAYILKNEKGEISFEDDISINGIFSKNTWQILLEKVGFKVFFESIEHSEIESGQYIGIVGLMDG
ncbi:class I SAM-dependent methyltransferase [candidate division WOR-3 bacterium]|nr:class I SAM-dependent methyltransferase [candidate division WOR-3 bacterium]